MENTTDVLAKMQLLDSKLDILVEEARISKRNRRIFLILTLVFIILPFIILVFILPSIVGDLISAYQI